MDERFTIPEVDRKKLLPQHDLDMLEEMAKGAGHEQWTAGYDDHTGKVDYSNGGSITARADWGTYGSKVVVAGGRNDKGYRYGVLRKEDQDYIAMFDPPTVRKLIEGYRILAEYFHQSEKQRALDETARKRGTYADTEE